MEIGDLKSKIRSKKAIKFGQTIEVSSLSSPNVEDYTNLLKTQNPNITPEDLNRQVLEMVKRDSYYNAVMDEVARAYEFDLDEQEIKDRMEVLSQSKPDIPIEHLRSMVEIPIFKKLIYSDLEMDWEIKVSDDVVKESLENFYKNTGQPIREYLMDKKKFEEVRNALCEQIITDRLMNAFNVVYKLQSNN